MHYFKRNIGEYHKKAGKLSMLEHGAYTLLMDACYDRERFPGFDDAIDWCWARTTEELAAVEFVLKKFFTLTDGVYVQNRISEEIEQYHNNALINKEIALKREEKKRQVKARSVHEHSTNEHERAPKQEPLTINQEPLTIKPLKDITPQAADSVVTIFEHWSIRMNHCKAKLDPKRHKLINNALNLGYSLSDLIGAIDGCAKSPYHMGTDGRNTTVYDGLDLILRDASHIDKFIKLNSMPAAPSHSQAKFDPLAYVNAGRAKNDDLSGLNDIQENMILIGEVIQHAN